MSTPTPSNIPNVSLTPANITPRQYVPIVGTNFDRVAGVFLLDPLDDTYFPTAGFQVQDGQHLSFTVRPDTPLGLYTVLLVDLDENEGTSTAPALLVGSYLPIPTPPPVDNTVPADILARLRLELQDTMTSFQTVATADGETTRYELDTHPIDTAGLLVGYKVDSGGAQGQTGQAGPGALVTIDPTGYTLDSDEGILTFNEPPPDRATIVVSGQSYRYFSDASLTTFLQTAMLQHSQGRNVVDHNIDPVTGFKSYISSPFSFAVMPDVEILPLVIQAKIQALWVLATDAVTDIDVSEDGASIPVSERYRQLMSQIAAESVRYDNIAEKLNIGLGSIEMFNLRRVSRTTGRFIPIYVEKEYDDRSAPIRVYPPINHGSLDGSEGVDPYYTAIGP
jgi:hypothetical protein